MGRRRRRNGADTILQGVLLVDKPAGVTSHEVCQRIKARLRLGKVGHGGTLDPFATGLLPLLLNGATRVMPYLQNQDKCYEAVVRLGVRTDTMDPTGEVTQQRDASAVDEASIREALKGFLGEQQQTVPRFSAARVEGRRLYDYARSGEEVALPVKDVVIHGIELMGLEQAESTADVVIQVKCGAGTYVRALADDLGEVLGVGGHLHMLRRTSTGSLSVDDALPLDHIVEKSEQWRTERQALQEGGEVIRFVPEDNARRWRDFLAGALCPVADLLGGLPTLRLPDLLAARVGSGQPLRKSELQQDPALMALDFHEGDRLVLEDGNGLRGVAVVRATCSRGSLSRREAGAVVFQVERVLR
ncbi:MAG: tRNA pseudouridine(55) synthase TruB [Deltaproteobacteria bacterium]|nr:tRNA pseudouridine(55) synthase TruB [Deltaproteobacteria bacterium]